jgi:hypothetical protein
MRLELIEKPSFARATRLCSVSLLHIECIFARLLSANASCNRIFGTFYLVNYYK